MYNMDDSATGVDTMDTETSCPVCSAEFLDSEDLGVHMQQHSQLGESSHTRFCSTCIRTFPDIEYYALHIINSHLSTAASCKYCSRVFYDRNKLIPHERKHKASSLPRLSCSQCDRFFCTKMELETHEYNKHADVDDGIMLQKCFSILSSLLNMNIRRFFAVPYEDFLYNCTGCNLSTHSVEKYIKHLRLENVKSYTCDKCCHVLSSKYNLLRHMTTKPMCQNYVKPASNEQCEKCHKSIDQALYKEHIKLCPGNFNINSIENSLKLKDNAAPLQTCKLCNRPFVGSESLKKHIDRAHKDNLHLYKYTCLSCDVVFKHPKILFSHYFTKHKDLKPYTCKICNEKFRVRKGFTLHIKLKHKSIGYVEFDDNYHVFFTDKKSEKPFQPQSQLTGEYTLVNGTTAKRNRIKTEIAPTIKGLVTINKNKGLTSDNKGKRENKPQAKHAVVSDTEETIDSIFTSFDNEDSKDSKKDSELNQDGNNSSITQASETEGELTEVKSKRKHTKRTKTLAMHKSKKAKFQSTIEIFDSDPSSDDSNMPLFSIRKGVKSKQKKNRKQFKVVQSYIPKKYKFMCTVCNKNCYTYQNYHYHLSLHKKYKKKKCIKCDETFKSKSALTRHMQTKHSSSQLTDTLKQLLERRKNNVHIPKDRKTIVDGLLKTIRKVIVEEDNVSATITPLDDKLSAKNFLENFKPDTEAAKDITVNSSITIKVVNGIRRKPVIQMTKFNQEPMHTNVKIRMPVKFKVDPDSDRVKVSIKLAQGPVMKPKLRFTHQVSQIDHSYTDLIDVENNTPDDNDVQYDDDTHYDNVHHDSDQHNDNLHDDNVVIPEVAEEVMLNTEEDIVQRKVIIPNLPDYPNIRIAHLQSQAPFYKIVKLNQVKKPKNTKKAPPVDNITLPDGTKLVTVNPLAHLMGNADVEEIFKGKRKGYEPKYNDIKSAIVKALDPKHSRYYKKKMSKPVSDYENILPD